MALIQAAQIPSDKKLSVKDIKKLGEFADKVSVDDLKKFTKNYNQAPKGDIVDLKTFLDSVKKTGEAGKPGGEGAEKPAAEDTKGPSKEDGEEGTKKEGIKVIDGEKAKVVTVPAGLKWDGKAAGLVLNPRWKHHYSETTIYKVDVRFYDGDIKGRPIFIIRNVETKVLKKGRRWLDPDKKNSLRIVYTTQFTYSVGTTYLKKGGKCVGVVDASAKF